jgi:hypothetical protein
MNVYLAGHLLRDSSMRWCRFLHNAVTSWFSRLGDDAKVIISRAWSCVLAFSCPHHSYSRQVFSRDSWNELVRCTAPKKRFDDAG